MDIYALLREHFPLLKIEADFSFSEHTTIGCGGSAAVAAYPASEAEAALLLGYLEKARIPHYILGAGANVLPPDGRYEGVILKFTRLNGISLEGDRLIAGAGVSGGALIKFVRDRAISGFAPLAGIPMTVGGGTAMNAGVREGHFSDLIVEVEGIESGVLRKFSLKECAFREKDSVFLHGIAVAKVIFRAERGKKEQIEDEIRAFLARRASLPKGRSMGCTFVNPPNDSAGRLIDACGLKGLRIGGAFVSEAHANFIISEGGTSAEVGELARLVQSRVFEKTGILLREEIRRIPPIGR